MSTRTGFSKNSSQNWSQAVETVGKLPGATSTTSSEINFVAFNQLIWSNDLNGSGTLLKNFCHFIFQSASWHHHWNYLTWRPATSIFSFSSNQRIFGSIFWRNLVKKWYLITWLQNFTCGEQKKSGSLSLDKAIEIHWTRLRIFSVRLLLPVASEFPLVYVKHVEGNRAVKQSTLCFIIEYTP